MWVRARAGAGAGAGCRTTRCNRRTRCRHQVGSTPGEQPECCGQPADSTFAGTRAADGVESLPRASCCSGALAVALAGQAAPVRVPPERARCPQGGRLWWSAPNEVESAEGAVRASRGEGEVSAQP